MTDYRKLSMQDINKIIIQKKDSIKLYKMRQQYLTKIFACNAYYFDSEELDEC